jgi:hypothetical protein
MATTLRVIETETLTEAQRRLGVARATLWRLIRKYVVNLGAGLAIEGFRVLRIDLDSQCNLTRTGCLAKIILKRGSASSAFR